MGTISKRDLEAINRAISAGMIFTPEETTDSQHSVMRVQLGNLDSSVENARLIFRDTIEGIARTQLTKTTIHLDLQAGAVPEFVIRAIDDLQGFGLRLVVTHKGECSHTTDTTLNEKLLSALIKSSVGGVLWHPLKKTFVDSRPFRTRAFVI